MLLLMLGLGMNILYMLGVNDIGGIFFCKDLSLVVC